MLKKLLAMLLCLTMCISMFPMAAFAEEEMPAEEADVAEAAEGFAEPDTAQDPELQLEDPESGEPVDEENGADPESVSGDDEDLGVAALPSEEDGEEEQGLSLILNTQVSRTVSLPENGQADNDSLFEGYVYGLFYPGEIEVAGDSAGQRLSGADAVLYGFLRPKIAEVAEGEQETTVFSMPLSALNLSKTSWSAEELGVSALVEDDALTEEAGEALMNQTGINMGLVLSALLSDCPYELYWYDKVAGTGSHMEGLQLYYDPELACDLIDISAANLIISMSVAEEYQAGEYSVASGAVITAKNAAANAQSIAEDYVGQNNYEKLLGFKNEICTLVDYNFDALDESVSYGDPWQLI